MNLVLLTDDSKSFKFNKAEVREEYYRASGPGGQHRNKVETAVRLIHVPTNIVVTASEERSQWKNRQVAWHRLELKLKSSHNSHQHELTNDTRSNTFGQGRQWSWTEWRDEVKAPSGVKYSMKQLMAGRFDKIK